MKEPNGGAFSARVSGRVQGVGFRYAACHEARRAGLCGWVRNARNGDVEIWAEGPPVKLEAFLRWLRRGPPGARVDSVSSDPCPPAGYKDFSIDY
ncbi:MAG: acylphosphatase [Spirochaetaceae bacterium]|nr:acylphosphatase [Spirochaetaceae bacterium]